MATTADQVRLLTGLTVGELTDENIASLLELNGDVVKLAAADALETLAGTLATISAESDDIKIDGSKRAGVLMARAARLREQAAAAGDDGDFAFDIVGGVECRPELTPRVCW
jgi:hypothetical protein